MFIKWLLRLVIGGAVIFGAIQFIPKPAALANPPVQQEPNWDSPQTRAIAERACSEWGEGTDITGDFAERTIRSGKMPLARYLMLHPEAKLTSVEQEQLIAGLKTILE
jgi:hypothetical protein